MLFSIQLGVLFSLRNKYDLKKCKQWGSIVVLSIKPECFRQTVMKMNSQPFGSAPKESSADTRAQGWRGTR